MEMTNFRMSGVSYLYEGLASSILASPKAYIILTLTAMFASHMNVRYGWDFSGILIPALIALQWYQPTKIITSFAEAIVICSAARQIGRAAGRERRCQDVEITGVERSINKKT